MNGSDHCCGAKEAHKSSNWTGLNLKEAGGKFDPDFVCFCTVGLAIVSSCIFFVSFLIFRYS